MTQIFSGISDFHKSVLEGGNSLLDTLSLYGEKAQKINSSLNAYIEIFDDVEIQVTDLEKRKNAKSLPLYGVPFAIKDNILIKGKKAQAGSHILHEYRAPYDATAIKKLKDAGAIFMGRANMDEFAMGGSTESSYFGITKNPHDETRVPGGSSGGSAVAVSGDLVLSALGSDTGGSVRQPAAFCGVAGLKPTYGAISRYGLIAMASSFDQIGPIAKNVEDAERIFSVIKGKDSFDATSIDLPKEERPLRKKIAYPGAFIENGMDEDAKENFLSSVKALSELGYIVESVEMPTLAYALPVYYIIMPAEASSNLARFDGVRYGLSEEGGDHIAKFFKTRGKGFGKEVKRRILLGTYVLSAGYYDAYYTRAMNVRVAMRKAFDKVFETYDAFIMPTTPTPAFKIGEKTGDPLTMYLADIFTVSANLVGIPALSVPSGTVLREEKALPLGLQILGPRGGEHTIFEIGKQFEKRI